jgi:hypothetical protein
MHGLVRWWVVGGRVEPDCGAAGHAAPDEIVGLVLELVEPANRHRRVADHGGFHAEPVPEPAHPDGLDLLDTGDGSDAMFGAVDQGWVDAIQQAPADVAGRAPQQDEYHGADQHADDRIGQRETGPRPDHAEHHCQRGEPVGAGMHAVGDQRRRVDLATDPDPVDGDQLVADEPDQPGRSTQPRFVNGSGWRNRRMDWYAANTADDVIIVTMNSPARSSTRP